MGIFMNRTVLIIILVALSQSCVVNNPFKKLDTPNCGKICPKSSKLSVAPILGLEITPFINNLTGSNPALLGGTPSLNMFGLINLDDYETSNFSQNGVLHFTDNNDSSDLSKYADADFRDLSLDPVNYPSIPLDFSINIGTIMNSLSGISLSPRIPPGGVSSNQFTGQPTKAIQSFFTNDMKNKTTGRTIKVTGTAFPEKFIIDLFSDESMFNFDAGGSPYQRKAILDPMCDFCEIKQDGVEIRNSLVSNQTINITNLSDMILMSNSGGLNQGKFKNIDYLNLGIVGENIFYLYGQSPVNSTLNRSKIFNIGLDNYRTNTLPLVIKIAQGDPITVSVKSSDYQNYLLSPTWIANNYTFNAAKIGYLSSSLLREGIPPEHSSNTVKNNRWNSYGNASMEIVLKDHKNNCEGIGSQSEVQIKRGKLSRQITDNFCGVREYYVKINHGQVLDIQMSTQSLSPAKHFLFNMAGGLDGTNKVRIYVPSSSKESPDNNAFVQNNMETACGNTIVNHKFGTWFNSPNVDQSGITCVKENSNIVAVDATSTDIQRRVYSGFKKVKIYDSVLNKNNWIFNCELDGALHTNVHLKHTDPVTHQTKDIRFFDFTRRGADRINTGICGNKLRLQYQPYDLSRGELIGTPCSVDDVQSGSNNCVSDESGTGFFRVEFMDTDNINNGTIDNFIGRDSSGNVIRPGI
jgi:hypothetical protein